VKRDLHAEHPKAHQAMMKGVKLPAVKVRRRREPSVKLIAKTFVDVAAALEPLEPIERERVLAAVRVFFQGAP
jgi:hypothetical protein